MNLGNNASKRSILYLFIAMVISLAVGGYCQTKFTPIDNSSFQKPTITTKTSTTL